MPPKPCHSGGRRCSRKRSNFFCSSFASSISAIESASDVAASSWAARAGTGTARQVRTTTRLDPSHRIDGAMAHSRRLLVDLAVIHRTRGGGEGLARTSEQGIPPVAPNQPRASPDCPSHPYTLTGRSTHRLPHSRAPEPAMSAIPLMLLLAMPQLPEPFETPWNRAIPEHRGASPTARCCRFRPVFASASSPGISPTRVASRCPAMVTSWWRRAESARSRCCVTPTATAWRSSGRPSPKA